MKQKNKKTKPFYICVLPTTFDIDIRHVASTTLYIEIYASQNYTRHVPQITLKFTLDIVMVR